MKEIEINSRAKKINSIPFALRVIGAGILLSLIPLGLAFHEYNVANPNAPLNETFIVNLETVLNFHKGTPEAIWMKVFLLTLPLGLLVVIYGLSQTVLRHLIPLVLGLAISLGLLCAHLLVSWLKPDILPPPDLKFDEASGWIWLAVTLFVGSIVLFIGAMITLKNSVLVKTFFNLIIGTAFSLLITLTYPFILLGGAYFLNKKRNLPFSSVLTEAGNLYNFLILNIYPIFFQILPGLNLVKRNAKKENQGYKKKYKDGELPKYNSTLDFDKLRFGDVILTGRPQWGKSMAIQAANLLSCGEESRYWSHAVIYSGQPPNSSGDSKRHNIIEAQSNGKGVQEVDLITGEKVIYETDEKGDPKQDENHNFIIKEFTEEEKIRFNYDHHNKKKVFTPEEMEKFSDRDKELCYEKSYFDEGFYLMVLRPKYADRETLEKVIAYCRKKDGAGCGYDTWGVSFYSLCALVPPMLSGWLEEKIANKIFNVDNAYFCSELLADAFEKGATQKLFDRSAWRVKPLDFRLNPLFEEVDCGYKRIPVNQAAKDEVAERIAAITEMERKVEAFSKNFSKEQLVTIAGNLETAKHAAENGLYPSSKAVDLDGAICVACGSAYKDRVISSPQPAVQEMATPNVLTPETSPPGLISPELLPQEAATSELINAEITPQEVATSKLIDSVIAPQEETTSEPINSEIAPQEVTTQPQEGTSPKMKPSDVKFEGMKFPKMKPPEKKGDESI